MVLSDSQMVVVVLHVVQYVDVHYKIRWYNYNA